MHITSLPLKEHHNLVEEVMRDIAEDVAEKHSTRFSKTEFEALFYAVLSDPDFNVKKWLLRNKKLVESYYSVNKSMKKFLKKLLIHAGIDDEKQLNMIIETFEYKESDVRFMSEAVDEAMFLYLESGKCMHIFRDKLNRLALKKAKKASGKYAGKLTYRRTIIARGDNYAIVPFAESEQ